MELYNKGYLDDVSVDIENQRALTRFLDAGKIYRYLSFSRGILQRWAKWSRSLDQIFFDRDRGQNFYLPGPGSGPKFFSCGDRDQK
jgi:hypothetical protein